MQIAMIPTIFPIKRIVVLLTNFRLEQINATLVMHGALSRIIRFWKSEKPIRVFESKSDNSTLVDML